MSQQGRAITAAQIQTSTDVLIWLDARRGQLTRITIPYDGWLAGAVIQVGDHKLWIEQRAATPTEAAQRAEQEIVQRLNPHPLSHLRSE